MKHKVLFVDDEPALLEGLQMSLRKQPFHILTARSGREGLMVLEDEPGVEVVVSDEQMPGMSGAEFLGEVRAKYPSTYRIILSGQATVEAAIRAINEGETFRFLTKPCSPAMLGQTIREAVLLRSLAQESAKLLASVRKQKGAIHELEREHPGIGELKRAEGGQYELDESGDPETLLAMLQRENEGR